MERIDKELIAPCGMNCGVCKFHLKPKKPCQGCASVDSHCARTLVMCRMRTCTQRSGPFCFDCDQFPCNLVKHIDKRYREKYGMSEIENLEFIRDQGMEAFLMNERRKYQSEQGILSVHDRKYYP